LAIAGEQSKKGAKILTNLNDVNTVVICNPLNNYKRNHFLTCTIRQRIKRSPFHPNHKIVKKQQSCFVCF